MWAGLTAPSGWMMCQPSTLCTGCEISFVLRENAALSNGGTVWKQAPLEPPCAAQSLPPWAAEPVSFEYFFARAAKLAPPFSFVVQPLGEALAVDEDVPNLARLRRRERRLVLVVVLERCGVRHLDVRRHLALDLLAEQVRPELVLLELGEGDVVLLQRGVELLLAAAEVRLLDLRDLLVDVLLGHRHAQLLALLRQLLLLHEEGDGRVAEGRIGGGADLRRRLSLRLVACEGRVHQLS